MLNDTVAIKTFEFKLRPNKAFEFAASATLEHCRQLYNAALQERIGCYKLTGKGLSYFTQGKHLTDARTLPDVKDYLRQIQQDTLKRLDRSYDNFFRRVKNGDAQAGFPRFKGVDRFHSFGQQIEVQRACPLRGEVLRVPGVGSVRVRLSRPIEGKVKHLIVSRRADGWYALLVCEIAKPEPLPETGDAVGIDVGLENFATLSTGEAVDNPRYFRKAQAALASLQRKASRKKRRSNNRKKANMLVGKKHLKVTRQRKDFFHKTANAIVREFDAIAVEDLNIKGLVKNYHLAKSISDASWGNFIVILSAKAENAGRRFVKVPAAYTSIDCAKCGHRGKKKPLSLRIHICEVCGFTTHRDTNSALEILNRGIKLLGLGKPEFTPVESYEARRSRNAAPESGTKGIYPCGV